MFLTGPEIARLIEATAKQREAGIFNHERDQGVVITPYNPKHTGPNSHDLTLGDTLLVYAGGPGHEGPTGREKWGAVETYAAYDRNVRVLDARADNPTVVLKIPEDGLVLLPGEVYLGRTVEWTETYGLAPMVEGRSSVARLGISVHLSAGWGDCGFKGTFTLEITVARPVRIYPFTRVCQIMFSPLQGVVANYRGKYAGQVEPTASRLRDDEENRA